VNRTAVVRAVALVVALAAILAVPAAAGAQSLTGGPAVVLDRYELSPGDDVNVTLSGFQGSSITISTCGNKARRGSADCNMPESRAVSNDGDGNPFQVTVPVTVPPVPCPCVIRASNPDNTEAAIAEFSLLGHPTGPVQGDLRDPLEVDVTAQASPVSMSDRVRGAIGGTTTYALTIVVRNRSVESVGGISASGTAVRNGKEVVVFDVVDPGTIGPGSLWTEVVEVELPGPSFGETDWTVEVVSPVPTISATDTTKAFPWLLFLLGIFLVVDIAVLVARAIARRRSRSARRRRTAAMAVASADPEVVEARKLETVV
jgi:hypothetical protein